MSVQGKFSTMSMADVIQWARTAQRSGTLNLAADTGKEVKVIFRDGRIVLSSTNETRATYGRYLVSLGLCRHEDVEGAVKEQEITGAMFASILVRGGKISEAQAVATLTEKTVEDLCDVFLWKDGTFEFVPRAPQSNLSIVIGIDPIRIVSEGVRRIEIWTRITAYVHGTSFYERSAAALPSGFTFEDERMVRAAWQHLDGEQNVNDLIALLPFSRYKIFRAVSELIDHKLIRPAGMTALADREKRITAKLQEADAAVRHGRWTEAIEILHGLSKAHPGRNDLVQKLLEVTDGFRSAVYEHNFSLTDVPVVTIGPDALARLALGPADAFVLSRVDGRLTVQQILRISPISEVEGLRTFKRLLASKVIDFPSRHSASPRVAAAVS